MSSVPDLRNERTDEPENERIPHGYGEDRFRLHVEAMRDYAVVMLDPEGRIQSWNAGAELIIGYRAEEVIGRHFSIFYPAPDIQSGKTEKELEIAKQEGRFKLEGWRVRKDGSQFWAEALITALRDEAGRLHGFSKLTRDLTERKRTEDMLRFSIEQLEEENKYRIAAERSAREAEASVRDLSQRLLRLQDDERRRLGRELHDGVGQLLVAAKMALGALGSEEGRRNFDQELANCSGLLDLAMRELRTMSYLLYPPMLEEMGLRAAIEMYLEGFRQRSGIRVEFEAGENFGRLPRDTELALFRVLQESLTNVHRHSGSRTAQIRLGRKDETAVLEIEDQGKGAPAAALQFRGDSLRLLGVGLRGMNERVQQIGGRLELFSGDKGMMVRATVPLRGSEDLKSHAAAAGS